MYSHNVKNTELKYNIYELLNSAIMSGIPVLLVEGKDDVHIYDSISKKISKEVTTYSIENIAGYSEGCTSLLECVKKIQPQLLYKENSKYFLGIIDRDARYFRDEIPNNISSLLVLNCYSIENHFITPYNVKRLLSDITYLPQELIDNELIQTLEKEYKSKEPELFAIALEALKFSCEKNYNSIVKYSMKAGQISNNFDTYIKKIDKKSELLHNFCLNFDIKTTNIKQVIKGKWHLHFYYSYILKHIKNLPQYCRSGVIKKCKNCASGINNKCLYSLRVNYQIGQICELVKNHIDSTEFEYIIKNINKLA